MRFVFSSLVALDDRVTLFVECFGDLVDDQREEDCWDPSKKHRACGARIIKGLWWRIRDGLPRAKGKVAGQSQSRPEEKDGCHHAGGTQ